MKDFNNIFVFKDHSSQKVLAKIAFFNFLHRSKYFNCVNNNSLDDFAIKIGYLHQANAALICFVRIFNIDSQEGLRRQRIANDINEISIFCDKCKLIGLVFEQVVCLSA